MPRQEQFGRDKEAALPDCCRRCKVRFICHGGCPKDRFLRSPDGQPGLNYLCAGFREFFEGIDPWMRAMAEEVRRGGEAAAVMRRFQAGDGRLQERNGRTSRAVGRNEACPCGSGKKYKTCCMRR